MKQFLIFIIFRTLSGLLCSCSQQEVGYLIGAQSADGMSLYIGYQWNRYGSATATVNFVSGGYSDRQLPADITSTGLTIFRYSWGSTVTVSILEIDGSKAVYKNYSIDPTGKITKL